MLTCNVQHGLRSVDMDVPYSARSDFESALTHSPDHPAATVGLSTILLDIYSEQLPPKPTIPSLDPPNNYEAPKQEPVKDDTLKTLPSSPLGLGPSSKSQPQPLAAAAAQASSSPATTAQQDDDLPEPYKATRLPLVDRLAARDRAYALLSGLTRLGSGWNYSEAWFALARAYEECGQPDKAKEVLWWCVELEESKGIREWNCLGGGGYII